MVSFKPYNSEILMEKSLLQYFEKISKSAARIGKNGGFHLKISK